MRNPRGCFSVGMLPGPGASPPARNNVAIGAAYTMRLRNNVVVTLNPEFVIRE
jgi:hypothetical protein